ncbi:D-TA family PLP-dependent enzyme [Thalassospira sp. A3_1]|uniref:D-TA family PLP-dependent enzyme n=1 Tax=Thalassospira sp. A3_1 TaxID=2821088 RepID=UPI001ADA4A1A|nr:D-TA family PLP-dependent enzyme [Thalassospira sp. A3_1]MBO9508551.1 D-TA family PLP-dependent enzyme [Thalassospira sp. A3_1]
MTGMPQYPELDTPCAVVDLDTVDRNIESYQAYCDKQGIGLRPHIKTHKIPAFAAQQMKAGALGITCQKIGEAEVMADAGLDDILLTYNVLGERKLARLRALFDRIKSLRVVADNAVVVEGLSKAFADSANPLEILIECDTGGGRCGVQNPAEAVELAKKIKSLPGISFAGLMTYPATGGGARVEAFFTTAMKELDAIGIECPVRSSGGTPDMWLAHEVPSVTEHRIGTYIYNDRSLMARGVCKEDDCALRVLTEIVSLPTPGRAIIDAGSKVLTSDLLGLEGYGYVVGYPDVAVKSLSEEHGILHFDPATQPFEIGQRIEIIPNHVCVVSNMLDQVHLVRDGDIETVDVAARGCVL